MAELPDPDDDTDDLAVSLSRDRDGVDSLRDTEAEQGDEESLDDLFDLDDREAKELGVSLDGRDEPEPGLN
jgi:hypothetical protein